ncbi:hypothetical protein Zmor_025036 [Zophobas morio]|uniref:Uncharacterized protein n=1 Tax=Zophobas morio TaxID=2755281 RepID=A0AA38M3C8_9CUCU|nr:hypothetical protein Zmor_025036 [Zophobas morio]
MDFPRPPLSLSQRKNAAPDPYQAAAAFRCIFVDDRPNGSKCGTHVRSLPSDNVEKAWVWSTHGTEPAYERKGEGGRREGAQNGSAAGWLHHLTHFPG